MEIAKDHEPRPDRPGATHPRGGSVAPGDLIAFELPATTRVVRKVFPERDDYLHGVSETMDEWSTPEDEDAWGDL